MVLRSRVSNVSYAISVFHVLLALLFEFVKETSRIPVSPTHVSKQIRQFKCPSHSSVGSQCVGSQCQLAGLLTTFCASVWSWAASTPVKPILFKSDTQLAVTSIVERSREIEYGFFKIKTLSKCNKTAVQTWQTIWPTSLTRTVPIDSDWFGLIWIFWRLCRNFIKIDRRNHILIKIWIKS